MKKAILFLLFTLSFSKEALAETKTFFRADYGMGKFKSDKLDSLNANPSGSNFGLGFGSRMGYVEVGLFYKGGKYESDIKHDGVTNKIDHKSKSFGLDLNIFLNRHLSLKVGYAVNNYSQKLTTPVSALTMSSIKTTYGLEDDKTSSNIFYGANVDIFGTKTFDLYASVLHFPMGDGKSTLTGQVGIRMYMKSSFADFFDH